MKKGDIINLDKRGRIERRVRINHKFIRCEIFDPKNPDIRHALIKLGWKPPAREKKRITDL